MIVDIDVGLELARVIASEGDLEITLPLPGLETARFFSREPAGEFVKASRSFAEEIGPAAHEIDKVGFNHRKETLGPELSDSLDKVEKRPGPIDRPLLHLGVEVQQRRSLSIGKLIPVCFRRDA